MGVDRQPLDFVSTYVTADKLKPSPDYPKLEVWEAERMAEMGRALQTGRNLPEATKLEYLALQRKAVGILPTELKTP